MKALSIRIICLAAILPMAIQATNTETIQQLAKQASISLSNADKQCLDTTSNMDPQAIKSCVEKSLPDIIDKAKKAAEDSGINAEQACQEIKKTLSEADKSAEEIKNTAANTGACLKNCESCDTQKLIGTHKKITSIAKKIIKADIIDSIKQLTKDQARIQAATNLGIQVEAVKSMQAALL